MKGISFKTILKSLLPVVVTGLFAVFFFMTRSRFETGLPEISHEDGFADLRDYDFDDQVYNLVNNWDYYPGELLTPEDFKDPDTAPVPPASYPYPLNANLGTYRQRFLAKPNTWLSLCGFSVDYATRVFVNGEEVRNIGYVSADPAEAEYKVRYMTIPMYSGETGEIEIMYQCCNYFHKDGGFVQATYISTPENIDEYQRGIAAYSLFVGSGLMFLMFWFLLSAAIQRNREYASLAICCLVIAFRNQFFFAEYMLNPGYDFSLQYRMQVLDVSLIPACGLYLLYAFFPKAIGKISEYVLAGVFVILAALHWIVGLGKLVDLCHICWYCCAPFLLWFVFRLLRHFIIKRKITVSEIVTLCTLFAFIVLLVIEGLSSGSSQKINHFGITPFVLVICLMILAVVINARIQKELLDIEEIRHKDLLLEQVNEMNRDYLRMVAHELKSPLSVISEHARLSEMQISKNDGDERIAGRLRTVRDEADRLGEIVTRLMDYTYNPEQEVKMEAVDVEALLKTIVSVMKPICEKNGNRLSVRKESDRHVLGNFELLQQVLINLVANANRYTWNGNIVISTEDRGENTAFMVSDTGSGIPPEAIPHIFEKGYTTGGGNGLGLAICMETIRLHSGEFRLVRTGSDGTSFEFWIRNYSEDEE